MWIPWRSASSTDCWPFFIASRSMARVESCYLYVQQMTPHCRYRECSLSLKSNYNFQSDSPLPGAWIIWTPENQKEWTLLQCLGPGKKQNLRPHSDLLTHHMLMEPSREVYACWSLKGTNSNYLYQASSSPNHSANCHQNYLPKTPGNTAVKCPLVCLFSS